MTYDLDRREFLAALAAVTAASVCLPTHVQRSPGIRSLRVFPSEWNSASTTMRKTGLQSGGKLTPNS